jgi:LDH2 family malate/lactate/ureidoglycolate dehydrogenase
MIVKAANQLLDLIRDILGAAGASPSNAARVAEALVSAHLAGVDTHGLWNLPRYVADIRAGQLLPVEEPAILRETPVSALITGNWTFGHVAAKYATDVAVAKAQQEGVAVVGVVQLHHIGRVGEYTEMAAARGMVSLIVASGFAQEAARCAPYGGRSRVLDTNPIAMGFPAGDEPPMMFDYATTAVSGVKVALARDRNQPLPPGCIIDEDGNPSTDAADFFAGGAYLPFGGHKGYAVTVAVEFLGRILTGAGTFSDVSRGTPTFRHQGMTLLVFKADLFRPFGAYADEAVETVRRIRAVPAAPGFTEVLVPGDLESRTRATRLREGIPIPEDIWRATADLATSLGLPPP